MSEYAATESEKRPRSPVPGVGCHYDIRTYRCPVCYADPTKENYEKARAIELAEEAERQRKIDAGEIVQEPTEPSRQPGVMDYVAFGALAFAKDRKSDMGPERPTGDVGEELLLGG